MLFSIQEDRTDTYHEIVKDHHRLDPVRIYSQDEKLKLLAECVNASSENMFKNNTDNYF